MPANLVWGLDLTGKRDLHGKDHPILGIVDHGSRFAVCLRAVRDKTAITILRALLDAIERHGRPASIRTDNEAVFTGWLFCFALAVLGVRHQRAERHCPWMNGRVERLFGTLKGKLDRWAVDGYDELSFALRDFRTWYNHVRDAKSTVPGIARLKRRTTTPDGNRRRNFSDSVGTAGNGCS